MLTFLTVEIAQLIGIYGSFMWCVWDRFSETSLAKPGKPERDQTGFVKASCPVCVGWFVGTLPLARPGNTGS